MPTRADQYRQAIARLDVLRRSIAFKPEFADDSSLPAALDLVFGLPYGLMLSALEKADRWTGPDALAEVLPEADIVKLLREGLSDG